jgi:hypothetical protein
MVRLPQENKILTVNQQEVMILRVKITGIAQFRLFYYWWLE